MHKNYDSRLFKSGLVTPCIYGGVVIIPGDDWPVAGQLCKIR